MKKFVEAELNLGAHIIGNKSFVCPGNNRELIRLIKQTIFLTTRTPT
jgi:hypothetical protein